MVKNNVKQIDGMFLIIERKNVRGLKHWGDELGKRGIPAVILIDEYMTEEYDGVLRNLSDRGFEIGGWYQEGPFWNRYYGFQYEEMSRIKDRIQSCINRPMRIFGSKYFAYDEVTLGIADELGVRYVTARGTAGVRAVVYKAEEYDTKIISVSNVPWKEMGGSLCEYSLWSRGATPNDFREIMFRLKEDRIILVAQTHISGVKLHWWNVYQDFLDSNIVTWKSLEDFAADPIVLPNTQIPINTEVKYATPQPKVPLEEEPDYPFDETESNERQKRASLREE